jgi:hypothetical protein
MAIYKLTLTFTKGSQSLESFKREMYNNCGSFIGGLDPESGIGQSVADMIGAAVAKAACTWAQYEAWKNRTHRIYLYYKNPVDNTEEYDIV